MACSPDNAAGIDIAVALVFALLSGRKDACVPPVGVAHGGTRALLPFLPGKFESRPEPVGGVSPLTAMTLDRYRMLLADLCRELRIADASPLLRDGRLVVDNIETALAHEHGRDGDHLWMCVDFGAVPDDGALRVYRAMLQANLLAGGVEMGMLTLQASGRVSLVVRRPLTPALDGERLARMLLGHADLAKGWVASVAGAPDGGFQE